MGLGRRRWLASERIAARVLEERGFEILEAHKKLVVDGVEVGEIDLLARGPDGSLYAVEVKAGRLDVHGVRQAYVNALVAGAKPLVVAKGFADDAAKTLAEKLGVEVVELEDVFLVDAEELEEVVETGVAEALDDLLRLLLDPRLRPRPEELEALQALAEKGNPYEAARSLGRSVGEMKPLLEKLRSTSLARRGPRGLRLAARLLLARALLEARLDSLEKAAERLEKAVERIGG